MNIQSTVNVFIFEETKVGDVNISLFYHIYVKYIYFNKNIDNFPHFSAKT